MYDIYISNLAASSRNIVCTKGLLVENPSKARWQAQNNTRERERRTYKIIAMPQYRILVGQAVRSRRNIILVVLPAA